MLVARPPVRALRVWRSSIAVALISISWCSNPVLACPPESSAAEGGPVPGNIASIGHPLASAGGAAGTWREIVESRRPQGGPGETVSLDFLDAKMTDTFALIERATGKPMTFRMAQLAPSRLTLTSDGPLPLAEAVDRLREAMLLNGVAVFEDDRSVVIEPLTEISRVPRGGLVLGPDDDLDAIGCDAVPGIFLFRVGRTHVPAVLSVVRNFLPDWATLSGDIDLGHVVLQGTTGVAKRVRRIIEQLDRGKKVVVGEVEANTTERTAKGGTPPVGKISDAAKAAHAGTARTVTVHDDQIVPPPFAPGEIEQMDRPAVLKALARVSRSRASRELDEQTRQRLTADFDRLMDRMKGLNPPK